MCEPASEFELAQPDDWHHHLRDGAALATTVPAAARQFQRAIIMPNLVPPVTTTEMAQDYKKRILEALHASGAPAGSFDPMMTIYLTDTTPPEEIKRAAESGDVRAFKLYPAGATTNSASGVTDLAKVTATLQAMALHGMPLCVHGEVTDADTDVFDRERVFFKTKASALLSDPTPNPTPNPNHNPNHNPNPNPNQAPALLESAPGLRVIFEHITTKEGAQFVLEAGPNVAGTVTPQHMLVNRNAMLVGGIRPHMYCLPILKTEEDRKALLEAVRVCDRIFIGTDSAPHAIGNKENSCGCAGCYSAHAALELYAEAFEKAGMLQRLEAFCSINGPAFYGVAPNTTRVTLKREEWTVPDSLPFGDTVVVPFRAGTKLQWRLQDRLAA